MPGRRRGTRPGAPSALAALLPICWALAACATAPPARTPAPDSTAAPAREDSPAAAPAPPPPPAQPAPAAPAPDPAPGRSTPAGTAGAGEGAAPGEADPARAPRGGAAGASPSPSPPGGVLWGGLPEPSGRTPDDMTQKPQDGPAGGPQGGAPTAVPAPKGSGTPPAGLALSVLARPPIASVGEQVTVEIAAVSGARVVDAPLHLLYDPERLRFVEASEGDYLGKDGGGTVFLVNAGSQPGDVVIGAGRTDRSRGVSGTGTLCRVRFEVLAPGTARVEIGRAMAWAEDGSPLAVTTGAAEIRVP